MTHERRSFLLLGTDGGVFWVDFFCGAGSRVILSPDLYLFMSDILRRETGDQEEEEKNQEKTQNINWSWNSEADEGDSQEQQGGQAI